tara:strand:- start:1212 stop:1514 length:303 start_codon:yes stop_codon:yes gene_type:complete
MVNNTPMKKTTKSFSIQQTVADELHYFAESMDESDSSALELILVEFLNAFGRIDKASDATEFNKAMRTNRNMWYTANTGAEFLISFPMRFVTAATEDELK